MSDPRNPLANLMPGADSAPAQSNEQKEEKRKADEKLKEWNEKIRQLYLDHYSNKHPDNVYRYHFKGSFTKDEWDLSGENTLTAASPQIHKLKDGRYVSDPNRGFDVIVEKGRIRTSPSANGRGQKANEAAWGTTFDFLKNAGVTNAYVAIESFEGYNKQEKYELTKVILKAAIHAQIGVTFDANFNDAIDSMDLKQRDELRALQREANFSHIGRKEIIFNFYYKGYQAYDAKGNPTGEGQPGLDSYGAFATQLEDKIKLVGDDPEAKLKLIQEEMVRIQDLEKVIDGAEAELQEYAHTVKNTLSDRKASEADVDLMKKYADKTQDIRDKLVSAVKNAREEAEKAREILAKELDVLVPPSEINKPVSSPEEAPVAASSDAEKPEGDAKPQAIEDAGATADEAGIEVTAVANEHSEISTDDLSPDDDNELAEPLNQQGVRDEELTALDKPATTLDASKVTPADTDKPAITDLRGSADKKVEPANDANALDKGAGAGVAPSSSTEKAAVVPAKPKADEEQQKRVAAFRDKLEKGRSADVLKKRKDDFDGAVEGNKAENIKALYEERKGMHYKR